MSAWSKTQAYRRRAYPRCRCRLPRTEVVGDLAHLGSGCTDEYVCPVLDKYRRLLGGSTKPEEPPHEG